MTTKSFDANRRKKVYPAIRKSPVIRFESDTPGSIDPIDDRVFSTYLTPTETQVVNLTADEPSTLPLLKTGIWETTPKTAMLNLLGIGGDETKPIFLLSSSDVDDSVSTIVFFSGETAVFGPVGLEDTFKVHAFGEVIDVYYSWSLIDVIEEN